MADIEAKIIGMKECRYPHTWAEIGTAVGLTADAVRNRYRRSNCQEIEPCILCAAPLVPEVMGLTAFDRGESPKKLWKRAEKAQDNVEERAKLREEQRITIPGEKAFGWAYLSDLHLGGDTNYKQIRRDAEIIRDTPRLWASFHGDATDNWIIGKLERLNRGQILTHDQEWQLFLSWLDMLGDKLLVVVPGNHDLWTLILAGVDRLRESLRTTKVLYDEYEVTYDLVFGRYTWRVKQRHQWRGSSVFNPTHGIEVGWERGSCEFDIGVGGHTHNGTVCRDFFRQGIRRHAILTGAYCIDSSYGRKLGMHKANNTGCGAMIHKPDGGVCFFENLELAAEFLEFLNGG